MHERKCKAQSTEIYMQPQVSVMFSPRSVLCHFHFRLIQNPGIRSIGTRIVGSHYMDKDQNFVIIEDL